MSGTAAGSPDDLFSVAGRTVIVTGGTRGLGRAMATGFAQRGAQVVITGLDPDHVSALAVQLPEGGKDRGRRGEELCLDPQLAGGQAQHILQPPGLIAVAVQRPADGEDEIGGVGGEVFGNGLGHD